MAVFEPYKPAHLTIQARHRNDPGQSWLVRLDLCLETKIIGDNDDKIMTVPIRNVKFDPLAPDLGAF